MLPHPWLPLSLALVLAACDPPKDETGERDADGDGYSVAEDCDDADAAVHPGATEVCNGQDDDCDGQADEDATDAPTWYADVDGDGFGAPATGARACAQPSGFVADATDCDDGDAAVHPGAIEACNGQDDDCDGSVDEDATDAATWYADADGDGWGDEASTAVACAAPSGFVAEPSDCDDADDGIHPSAEETCDGQDDDCDGSVDEDATDTAT